MDEFLDYEWAFDRLGVDETADWAAVTKAYRRMAQQAHPDRRDDQSGSPQDFIEISEAYNMLKAYWTKHQALPVIPARSRQTPPPTPKTAAPDQGSGRLRTIAWFLLALVPLIWILDDTPEVPEADGEALQIPAVDEPARIELISRDMTIGELAGGLGPPDETTANAWIYEDLLVFIRNGRVVDWELRHPSSQLGQAGGRLTYGFTENQVLELLGPPDDHSTSVWSYGQSKVFFTDGIVSGWFNAPGDPLTLD